MSTQHRAPASSILITIVSCGADGQVRTERVDAHRVAAGAAVVGAGTGAARNTAAAPRFWWDAPDAKPDVCENRSVVEVRTICRHCDCGSGATPTMDESELRRASAAHSGSLPCVRCGTGGGARISRRGAQRVVRCVRQHGHANGELRCWGISSTEEEAAVAIQRRWRGRMARMRKEGDAGKWGGSLRFASFGHETVATSGTDGHASTEEQRTEADDGQTQKQRCVTFDPRTFANEPQCG